jgi:hypothetical protein
MRTDPVKAGRKPRDDPVVGRIWRRWRGWLPFVVKPLRHGIVIFVLLLVVEYLVVPELVGASKDLYLLGRVEAAWLAAGLILETLSLFCYGLLTQAVLPPGSFNPACPGCSASTCLPRRSRTSYRPGRWAVPGLGTGCSPPRASRATTPR